MLSGSADTVTISVYPDCIRNLDYTIMQLLRRYQLDIIFYFFALFIIIGLIFYELLRLGKDPHDYEWLIVFPLVALSTIHLWQIRQKISLADRRALTGKTFVYWLLLSITLFASYQSPIAANDYWSINAMFIIFTLMLADSYWDFWKMTIGSILNKNK